MPATVELISEKPIIQVTIHGKLDVALAREIYHQIAKLSEKYAPPIYRITDVRLMETTFPDMIQVLKEAGSNRPGTTSDERIVNVFVGRHTFADFARNAMAQKQFGGKAIPVFDTIDEAIEAIHRGFLTQEAFTKTETKTAAE